MDKLFEKIGAEGDEAKKRRHRELKVAQDIYKGLFPQQRALVDDPNDYKVAMCPRRSGKSYVLGIGGALRTALMVPDSRVVIIGLVLRSVKGSFWRALDTEIRRRGIPCVQNRTDYSFTFENGSYVFLYGAETMDRIERLRGDEYDLAIIDEAGSFAPETLKYLIHDVLKPALGTRDGQLWMAGTPGFIYEGEFYWATNPGKRFKDRTWGQKYELGRPCDAFWSFHRWTVADNKPKEKQWHRFLRDKQKANWGDDHPTWRREYLGEWVLSEDGLVYSYAACKARDSTRVTWVPEDSGDTISSLPAGDWHYLLGIDFGFENPTAFTVCAYSQDRQELRVMHSEAHSHLVLSDVADIYWSLSRKFGGFEACIVDAGAQGKMIQETLASDYQVFCIPAEKRDKQAHIQALNSDFHSGRIKVLEDSDLEKELLSLSWDLSDGSKEELARRGRLKENPTQLNDCCDSFLYVWRYSAHRWGIEQVKVGPAYDTPEFWVDWEKQEKERFVEKRRKAKELDYWETQDHEDYCFGEF